MSRYEELANIPTIEAQTAYLYLKFKHTGNWDTSVEHSMPNYADVAALRFKAWHIIRCATKPAYAAVMKNGNIEDKLRMVDKADRDPVTMDEITGARQMINHRSGGL